MAPRPTDRGKDFLTGVLQHLPDHLRSGMEQFLGTPDAAQFVAQVGTGVLRQDEFSRQLDALQAERTSLQTWRDQLAAYAEAHPGDGDSTTNPDPDPKPAAAAATGSPMTQDQIQALLNTELGRREFYVAQFVADATTLAQEHYRRFGEVLEVDKILAHPKIGELRLRGAYEDLFKDKLAAHAQTIAAADRKKLEDEIRAQVVAELNAGPGATPLYPIGDSPLDHLTKPGEQPPTWDPSRAVRMYDELVSANQR